MMSTQQNAPQQGGAPSPAQQQDQSGTAQPQQQGQATKPPVFRDWAAI